MPAVARRWHEQWLAFPTVDRDESGRWSYWCVPADTGCYEDDWPVGERLASETLKQIRRFPEGSAVLRRLLREIDHDSIVGQGFLSRLEDTIAYPEVYEPDVPSRIANDVTLDHPID